jgi:hypothetical protein
MQIEFLILKIALGMASPPRALKRAALARNGCQQKNPGDLLPPGGNSR